MHLRLLGRVRIECNGAIDLMRLDPMVNARAVIMYEVIR